MLKRQAAIALLVLCSAPAAHTQQAAREQKPVKEHTFDLETSYIRMPLPVATKLQSVARHCGDRLTGCISTASP